MPELVDEPADGVARVVAGIVAGQQPALLGKKQKHHPHHHSDDPGVQVVVADPREQLAPGLPVELVEAPDKHLDGIADLATKGGSDLLLLLPALLEQRGEPIGDRDTDEPALRQQRDQRLERLRLLAPQPGVPHGGPDGPTSRRPHQRPPAPVRHHPDRHVMRA